MVKLICCNVKICNKKLFSFAKKALGILITYYNASKLYEKHVDQNSY